MKAGSNQAPYEYKDTYKDRVKWYNDIISEANIIAKTNMTDGKKQGAMNRAIIDAIVELKKTTNPDYTKDDIDRDTGKKIDEFSRQMVKSGPEKFKREGKSETRSNIMKFFTSLKNLITGAPENPANFLNDLYKEVVRSEEFKTNASTKPMPSSNILGPERSADVQIFDERKIMDPGPNPDAVTQFEFDDLPPINTKKFTPI